ncbi:hypothetical protein P8X24_00680 [Pyrococcus kukulkanii]|uniref:hypothetical protein n=1 Tax=Pyrococcus kukulkanii TaxID=1609559 RepID=UPI0035630DDC
MKKVMSDVAKGESKMGWEVGYRNCSINGNTSEHLLAFVFVILNYYCGVVVPGMLGSKPEWTLRN